MVPNADEADERVSRLLEFLEATPDHADISSVEETDNELVINLAESLDRGRLEDAVRAANEAEYIYNDAFLKLETITGPDGERERFTLNLVEDFGKTLHKQKVGPTMYPSREVRLGTANPVTPEGPASQNMFYVLKVLDWYLHQ